MKRIRILTVILLLAVCLVGNAAYASDSEDWMEEHAEEYGLVKCEKCGQWVCSDELETYCGECHVCSGCEEICEECNLCQECAVEKMVHCSECHTCFENSGKELDDAMCIWCGKGACCCDALEFAEGVFLCEDCIESLTEDGCLCLECGKAILEDVSAEDAEHAREVGKDVYSLEELDMAPCARHCMECFEEKMCVNCETCFLCEPEMECEYCGYCLECAELLGMHCPSCGACYEDVDRCNDGGDHCVDCCVNNEWLCPECGSCIEALGLEQCDYCGLCEECIDSEDYHCPECNACYECDGQCESGGNHCRLCCENFGWLCPECGICVEGAELEPLCEDCGMCPDCCRKASEKAGGDGSHCIMDEENEEYWEEVHQDHHVLKMDYNEAGHWLYCIVGGCDYREELQAHDPADEYRLVKWPTTREEGAEAITCKKCGYEYALRSIPKVTFFFRTSPKGTYYGENGYYAPINYEIGTKSEYAGSSTYWVELAYLPRGESWPEDPHDCRNLLGAPDSKWNGGELVRVIRCKPQDGIDFSNQAVEFRLILMYGDSEMVYSNSFKVVWTEKHIHFWQYRVGTVYGERYHLKYCATCGLEDSCDPCDMVLVEEQPATCKSGGQLIYQCSVCNTIAAKQTPVSKEHTPGAWQASGSDHVQHCVYCGQTLASEPHTYVKVAEISLSCTETRTVYVCSVCGKGKTKTGAGPGHVFTSTTHYSYDDTNHWYYCAVCHEKVEVEPHKLDSNGRCTVCGYRKLSGVIHQTNGDYIYGPVIACTHADITVKWHFENEDYTPKSMKEAFVAAGNWTFHWRLSLTGSDVATGKTIKAETLATLGNAAQLYCVLMNKDGTVRASCCIFLEYPHEHSEVASTCQQQGHIYYTSCDFCGKLFDKNGKEISDFSKPLGDHTYANDCMSVCSVCGQDTRTAPHAGYIDCQDENCHWKECKKCGYIQGEKEAHDLVWKAVGKVQSCQQDGTLEGTCTVCGRVFTKTVPATGHVSARMQIASTCMEQGTEPYYQCIYCKTLYADEACTKEITRAELRLLPLDPSNHVGGPRKNDADSHWIGCRCGEKLDLGPHSFAEKEINGQQVTHCRICGYRVGETEAEPKTTEAETEASAAESGSTAAAQENEENGLPETLLILIIVLAVLTAAVILLLIILNKTKKKKTS